MTVAPLRLGGNGYKLPNPLLSQDPLLPGDVRRDRTGRPPGAGLHPAGPFGVAAGKAELRAGGAGRSGGAQGATTRTDGTVAAPAMDRSP